MHPPDPLRERVLALPQAVRAGTRPRSRSWSRGSDYWFDGDDACVAYVDTGRRLGRGGGADARRPSSWRRRRAALRGGGVARRRRRRFFAAEARFADDGPFATCASASSRCGIRATGTRSLARRARPARAAPPGARQGVTARAVRGAARAGRRAAAAGGGRAPDRPLAGGAADGADGLPRPRAAFSFARGAALLRAPSGAARVVGFLGRGAGLRAQRLAPRGSARAIRDAPNGTAELLIDAAMRAPAAEESRYVTLGLAPLAGRWRPWLRVARGPASRSTTFAACTPSRPSCGPSTGHPSSCATRAVRPGWRRSSTRWPRSRAAACCASGWRRCPRPGARGSAPRGAAGAVDGGAGRGQRGQLVPRPGVKWAGWGSTSSWPRGCSRWPAAGGTGSRSSRWWCRRTRR